MTLESILGPRSVKSVAWWRVFLGGVVVALGAVAIERLLGAPGGPRWWTIGYGTVAATLFFAALLYGARRRMPRRGPGASYHWLQLHVYGGALFLLLVTLHTGASWPVGLMSWTLWGGAIWVVATGLLGVAVQRWVPRALSSGLTTEVHYDRIPELVDHVRARVERLMAAADESVRSYYQTDLAPAFAGPQPRLIYFVNVTGGIQARLRRLDYLRQFLDDDNREMLDELRSLVRAKLEMDAQYTLQRALRWWLYAHVPVAIGLAGLIVAHTASVLYY